MCKGESLQKLANQSYGSCVLHVVFKVLYICVKFGENISDGIRGMEYGADTNDEGADGRTLKFLEV